MNLTIHQIRVFITVAELGSVSLAAEKLHMTQPAVSNILKQLQSYYDCQLIEIISRRLYLTEFGKTLYACFIEIKKSVATTQDKINALKGAVSGTLSVATVSTAKYFMPKILGKFRAAYPEVNIRLSVLNRQGVLSRLQENLDDFCVMSHPPDTMHTLNTLLYDDALIAIASPKSSIASNSTLPIETLQNEPWLLREKGSGTLYATEEIFNQYAFTPNTVIEIGDIEAIKQSVIADFGISIISQAACALELADDLLQILPVVGFPVKHKWYVVRNKGKLISPLVERFIEFMYSHELFGGD